MEQQPVRKKKSLFWIILGISIALILAAGAFFWLQSTKENPAVNLSFEQCLAYTTQNRPDVKIGVVVLKNGTSNISFYGNNAERIPYDTYEYEIGSLTKTFTAALVMRAVESGAIQLDYPINRYLLLSNQNDYPTIEQLLTHTSGYKSYYFARPMEKNFLSGKNSFYGVTRSAIRHSLNTVSLADTAYLFSYSNFGYAVLGLILEEMYQTRYTELVNAFAQQELDMQDTRISD